MGKVLYIDPNPKGQEVVQHEDLSIFVELVTTKKSRSEINVDGYDKTINIQQGGEKIPIRFLKGTNDDNSKDGSTNLTTHYTEITTKFGQSNLDLETFGITSIDIDFNTSYTPVVKINFTDIRGRLFEMGNDSPYNIFFNLPYPMFELTVKGYYGKAVTYCLHLTKFSGKLDDKTGNFEIQCDFIGYTYAFLSDMLMGYLRGISETNIAKDKLKDAQEKFLAKGEVFLSFNELTEKTLGLNKKILKLKNDNSNLKELKVAEDVMIMVSKLKSELKQLLTKLTRVKGSDSKNIEISNGGVLGLTKDVSSTPNSDTAKRIEEIKTTHNKRFKGLIYDLNQLIGGYFFQLDPQTYQLVEGVNYGSGIRVIDFRTEMLDGGNNDKEPYNNQYGEPAYYPINTTDNETELRVVVTNFKTQEDYLSFRRNVTSLPKRKVSSDIMEMTYYDLSKMFSELNSVGSKLKKAVKTSKVAIADKLLNEIETQFGVEHNGELIKFTPSMKNMIRILTEHIHILLKCIKDVAEDVKLSQSNGRRGALLGDLNVNGRYDLSNGIEPKCGFSQNSASVSNATLNDVLPFPEYKERENGVFVDKWIGNEAPNIPEVLFIDDLLEGLIQAKKKDKLGIR